MLKSVLTAALLLTAGAAAFAAERPNILLLVSDDQYLYGYERGIDCTPNIDRLADEGLLFTRAYTTAACTPSRWNILTGKYCSRSTSDATINEISKEGQYRVVWNSLIDKEPHLLPRILQANGYFTGHIGKNHNGLLGNNEQQASVHRATSALKKLGNDADPDNPEVTKRAQAYQKALCDNFKLAGFDYCAAHVHANMENHPIKALGVHNMEWMSKGAIEFLDQAKAGDKPFFLYVATTLDHGPHNKVRSLHEDPRLTPAGKLEKPITGIQPDRQSVIQRAKALGLKGRDPSTLWLDDGIGAIVDHLKELDLDKDTLVIFMTDNGMKGGKGSAYEGGANIPMIFRWPGKIKPAQSEALIHTIDLAPTFLELCGITSETAFDGKNLLPLLYGRETKLRDNLLLEWGPTRAIVGPQYKYIAMRHPGSVISREDYEASVRRFRETTKGYSAKQIFSDPKFADIEWPYDQYAGYHLKPYKCGGTTRAAVKNYFGTIYDLDQLYDLSADSREKTNLASNPEYRPVLERLQKELSNKLKKLPGSFGEFQKMSEEEAKAWAAEYARRHPARNALIR